MSDKALQTGNRDKNGRFIKGNNSNGGRKPIPPEIKEALTSLIPRAVERLANIVDKGEDDKLVMEAVKVVFDRVYGKPQQAMEVKSENAHKIEVTLTEQLQIWAN